ncbi:MAG TPA: thymidine phosphorylase, partial [Gemmata sp.]
VNLTETEFRAALKAVGLGMIGQTADIAPADKTLYALRDVTATVESIPLITASILSKKLSEGISALVMDVKCGGGAFMKTRERARALADSIVKVGTANGLKMRVLLTAMDAPLGRFVGNALEVVESVETLKGNGPADLTELSVALAARMVRLAGIAPDDATAEDKVRAALASGAGLEVFRRCIEQQGGDPRVIDDYAHLPHTDARAAVEANRSGCVTAIDAEKVGIAVRVLGGGRDRAEDTIDPSVGVVVRARPGDRVQPRDPVFEIHHRNGPKFSTAMELLAGAFVIGDAPPGAAPLILEEIT